MMASISDIAALLRNGKSVQQSADAGGLPITRIETIADWTINQEKVGFAGLCREECEGWLLEDGDILISHINSTKHLGKCAIYEGLPSELVHGMNLLALRVEKEVADSRFIYRMLASPGFRNQLPQITKDSVNQSSFNISSFKKLQIPLPPLAEQKRIAAILDAADALRVKRRESLAQLDTLLQSTFLDMFGDPVTNPNGWKIKPFSTLATNEDGKRVPVKKDDREKMAGEFPYYGASGVIDFVNEYLFDGARLLIGEDGANLITRSTPIAFIAKGKYWVNNHAHVLSYNGKAELVFLETIMNALDLKPYLSGTAQPKLNQKNLDRIPIPTPPLDLQKKFATIVESIEQQRARMRTHLEELDTLFASLQHRAFNGEL